VERALLAFEKRLPSTEVKSFPVTVEVIRHPEKAIEGLTSSAETGADHGGERLDDRFNRLIREEKGYIRDYLKANSRFLSEKHNLTLTPARMDIVAAYYAKYPMDIGKAIKKIKSFYDDVKKIELYFYKSYDINIVLEEGAIDFIIEGLVVSGMDLKTFYRQLSSDFEHGLKLVQEKTGKNRFFITREALLAPETFIGNLLKDEMQLS
jgi:hypothetical protein